MMNMPLEKFHFLFFRLTGITQSALSALKFSRSIFGNLKFSQKRKKEYYLPPKHTCTPKTIVSASVF